MDGKKFLLWLAIVMGIIVAFAFLQNDADKDTESDVNWTMYDVNSSADESYLTFSGNQVVVPNPLGFSKIDRNIASTKLFFENLDSHPKMKPVVAYCKNDEAPKMLTEEVFFPNDMQASVMVDNQYVHVKMSVSEFTQFKSVWKKEGSKITKEAFTRIKPLADSNVDKINQAFATDVKFKQGVPLTLAIHDESDRHFSWLTYVKLKVDDEESVSVTCATMILAGLNQLQLIVTSDERNTNEIVAISKDWVKDILSTNQ